MGLVGSCTYLTTGNLAEPSPWLLHVTKQTWAAAWCAKQNWSQQENKRTEPLIYKENQWSSFAPDGVCLVFTAVGRGSQMNFPKVFVNTALQSPGEETACLNIPPGSW